MPKKQLRRKKEMADHVESKRTVSSADTFWMAPECSMYEYNRKQPWSLHT